MNGRCENHLLELAANVCDSCYGEFCDECLKQPGSRKHPICTDCILLASGVRTGAKTERRGEKRTARSRRKALQERQGSLPGAFRFFDEDQPSGVASEPSAALAAEFSGDAAKRGGRRRRGRRGPSAPSDAETPVLAEPADLHEVERHSSNEAAPAPAMTPAVAKLEAMRRGDDESFASTPTEGDEIIADNTVIDQTTAEGRIADPTDACDRAEVQMIQPKSTIQPKSMIQPSSWPWRSWLPPKSSQRRWSPRMSRPSTSLPRRRSRATPTNWHRRSWPTPTNRWRQATPPLIETSRIAFPAHPPSRPRNPWPRSTASPPLGPAGDEPAINPAVRRRTWLP